MISITDVEKAEDARCAAMLSGDIAWFQSAFSDQLLWAHASGAVDTKQSFIAHFQSGDTLCYRIDRNDVVIRVFGNAAIVTGLLDMEAMYASVRKAGTSRYQGVWVESDGQLKLAAWQSARLA